MGAGALPTAAGTDPAKLLLGRRAEGRKGCQAELVREHGEENRSTFAGNSRKNAHALLWDQEHAQTS